MKKIMILVLMALASSLGMSAGPIIGELFESAAAKAADLIDQMIQALSDAIDSIFGGSSLTKEEQALKDSLIRNAKSYVLKVEQGEMSAQDAATAFNNLVKDGAKRFTNPATGQSEITLDGEKKLDDLFFSWLNKIQTSTKK